MQSSAKQSGPLPDVAPYQSHDTHDVEDLKNFPRMACSDRRLNKVNPTPGHFRESSTSVVQLHKLVLLVPLIPQPQIELLLVVKRDVRDAKATPVEVD